VLVGGAGTDTLVVTANVLVADIAVPAASMSSIETVRIRAVDGDGTVGVHAATFAVGSSAITTVEASGNSNTTVTALNSGSAVGMVGDGATKNGILSYAYATATADQTINISGGTLNTGVADITATASAGVTKATINSTGAANSVDTIKLDSAGVNTVTSLTVNAATNLTATLTVGDFATTSALTVAGAAASVNLGTAGNFKTIDATGLTAGGLTIAGGTATTSFKGGAGNDVFTTAVYATPTAGMIAAGAGTDTLVLSSTTVMDSAAEAAYYTGFETLRTAGNQDMSILAGITALETTTTAATTMMTATQAAAVKVRADMAGSSFALADSSGTSDVLSLTMGTGSLSGAGAATEATDFTGALTMNGFETLNITTNAGESANVAATAAEKVTQINAITSDKLTAINLKGTSVELQNAATTKAVTIDASALTGNGTVGLTIAGNLVAGSTVTGSGVADSIALGTVGSTYNSGAGNDAFTATAVTQLQSGAVYNTLNGGDGTDSLTITSAGATMIDDDFKGLSNIETVTLTHTGAAASVTTGGWYDSAFKTAGSNLTFTTATDGEAVAFAGGTFSGAQTLLVTTAAVGDTATNDNVTVQTGTGNDTVTVTAASWVAANGANGLVNIKTGAGNDTITYTHGTQATTVTATASFTVTAGTGADVINATGINHSAGLTDTFVIAAGDSLVSAYDSITGFDVGSGALFSSTLDFASVGLTAYTATAATGFSAAELTVAVSAGLVTFAGTSAAGATLAQKIAAVQSVVVTNAGDSALFTHGSNSYVFNNNATADSLVELVGVAGTTLVTANATTANAIFIA